MLLLEIIPAVLKALGSFFFRFRDILPVPLALVLIRCSRVKPLGWAFGLPFVAVGEALRIWSLMHIGPTTRAREICADRLVQTGPYALCRNPLYLANSLKIIGMLCIAGNLRAALAVLIFYSIEFPCLISYEEAFLRQKFPAEHKAYAELVPVFFPTFPPLPPFESPKPATFRANAPFSLKDAIISERKTFGSTGLILGLAWMKSRFINASNIECPEAA